MRVREDGFVGGESQKLDGEGPFGGYDGGWYGVWVWGVGCGWLGVGCEVWGVGCGWLGVVCCHSLMVAGVKGAEKSEGVGGVSDKSISTHMCVRVFKCIPCVRVSVGVCV